MITAPELEIAVLVLGMVILMFEAFTTEYRQTFFGIRWDYRSRDGARRQLFCRSKPAAGPSDWFLELLHRGSVVDLL